MDKTEFLDVVAEILEVESGTVSFADNLDEIDWDSLSNITFIAEIDTRLGAVLDAEELSNAKTVEDLFSVVSNVAKG